VDGARFDALARTLAARGSRRAAMRAIIATALGGALGRPFMSRPALAWRPRTVPCAEGCPTPYFCDLTTNFCEPECPEGRRPCGIIRENQPVCCPPGEACIDPDIPKCGKCPPETPVCTGLGQRDSDCCHGVCCNTICCPDGKECCNNTECCNTAHGFVCDGSICRCESGKTICGELDPFCVDLQNDPANCGACGHACPPGAGCSRGVCCPAARTCPDRCCSAFQECCDDGICRLKGRCCPPSRACGKTCCAPGQRCCNGVCQPAGQECACPPERDCTEYDLGCCAEDTYCTVDYDGAPVCCGTPPCGGDGYCCGAGDQCLAGRCCDPGAMTTDGQCCGVTGSRMIACGTACCDGSAEVCVGGSCCNKTMVAAGECCKYIPPCNGQCCEARENCASLNGEPEHCVKLQ
jgi:hypothetical protein